MENGCLLIGWLVQPEQTDTESTNKVTKACEIKDLSKSLNELIKSILNHEDNATLLKRACLDMSRSPEQRRQSRPPPLVPRHPPEPEEDEMESESGVRATQMENFHQVPNLPPHMFV